MNLLDASLPDYQFREYHSLPVTASEASLWQAVKTVTPSEIGPLGWLMAIRSLPAKLAGRKRELFEKSTPILADPLRFVVLEERAPCELVLGFAGQFWKLDGGPRVDLRTAQQFTDFRTPGFLRGVLNFQIHQGLISTETRVQALDDSARRQFLPYWTLIRPGSGWIRLAWLRAIRKRALIS